MSGSIRRAFLLDLEPGHRVLDSETSKYLVTVLRLAEGDNVFFFDGQGNRASAEIIETHRSKTHVFIKPATFSEPLEPSLHLCCALPKTDRAEWIIEKCSELGVSSIHWVACERSQAPKKDHAKKFERWRKIAREAARQSHNDWVPNIKEVIPFREVCASYTHDTRIVLDTSILPSLVSINPKSRARYVIFVGPEGGFTADERDLLKQMGWHSMSLGTTILRVETAAVVGVGLIRALTSSALGPL